MFATFLQQAALVILILGQLTLGESVPKKYGGRYVTLGENGIGGTYLGWGTDLSDPDIAQLAKDAMLDARAVANEAGKSPPSTLAIYINPRGDLILAGSGGAGPGAPRRDAEVNVLANCAEQGLSFHGGKIISWNFQFKYFIQACENCRIILMDHGHIQDTYLSFQQYNGL
jgi:hypothetical protein